MIMGPGIRGSKGAGYTHTACSILLLIFAGLNCSHSMLLCSIHPFDSLSAQLFSTIDDGLMFCPRILRGYIVIMSETMLCTLHAYFACSLSWIKRNMCSNLSHDLNDLGLRVPTKIFTCEILFTYVV